MARSVGDMGTGQGRSITLSRPLEELVPTSDWERILADDEPVELDVSVVELVRTLRESGEG